jgi:hypothetical protein
VERQTGKRPAGLEGPPLPADGEHVWHWFLDLSAARGSNGFGPNPISYPDLAAWVAMTGIIVTPSEVAALLALDREYLAELAKKA